MLELLNKIITGVKEKLASAWTWFTGLFSSKKESKVEVATIETNDVNEYANEADMNNAKEANEFADEILNKDVLTAENIEQKVSEIKKGIELGGFARRVYCSKVLLNKVRKFLRNCEDISESTKNSLLDTVKGIYSDLSTEAGYVTEEVFNKSVFLDKEDTYGIVIVKEKK